MFFHSSNKNEHLFFVDSNFGIVIYNSIDKNVTLYEFLKENFIYKSSLKEILTLNNVEEKNVFKDLYLHTKNEILKSRYETPLNKEFSFFAGKNNNETTHFATNDKYLAFCGVETVEQIKAKVILTFNEEDDIKKEIDDYRFNEKYFYGFWDIKDETISSSFLYKHLIQTRMCFGDFGKRYLNEGSLFLKFEVIE